MKKMIENPWVIGLPYPDEYKDKIMAEPPEDDLEDEEEEEE